MNIRAIRAARKPVAMGLVATVLVGLIGIWTSPTMPIGQADWCVSADQRYVWLRMSGSFSSAYWVFSGQLDDGSPDPYFARVVRSARSIEPPAELVQGWASHHRVSCGVETGWPLHCFYGRAHAARRGSSSLAAEFGLPVIPARGVECYGSIRVGQAGDLKEGLVPISIAPLRFVFNVGVLSLCIAACGRLAMLLLS